LNSKTKLFYWSPYLVNIATPKAVINSALAMSNYSKNYECSVINFFGEFEKYKKTLKEKKVEFLDYYNPKYINFLPKHGKLYSRISFLIIFITSFFPLKKLLEKKRPDFIVIHLITSLPLILLILFNFKTKFILRISGYPKMNFVRKYLWKLAFKKIHLITCPTKYTSEYMKSLELTDNKKIKLLYDPIIEVNKINKKKRIKENNIRDYQYFISIGRLTRQKNFLFLCKVFKNIVVDNPNLKLLIAGEGEDKKKINDYIKSNSLEKNIILLGYVENIFPILINAKAFILSSLWEDPGFVLIESGFCKLPVITSDCPNGPKELIKHKQNGFVFSNNDAHSCEKQISSFLKDKKDLKEILYNNLKMSKMFSLYNHQKNFKNIIEGV
jgi:glycosyltransferase involved in cell wall biosynthesis